MLDLVQLQLNAGDGGNGRVSFRREKFILKGGPDGGNGGDGGSIVLVGSKHLSTLGSFAGIKEMSAKNGQNGGARQKIGEKADDLRVEVPVGTIVWLQAENKTSYFDRMRALQFEGSREYIKKHEQYWLDGGMGMVPPPPPDEMRPFTDGEVKLFEITEDGAEFVICKGGRGGRPNTDFASSSHTTPWEAEYGMRGAKKLIKLELKLLADVGLVGFPNAGKSTLLSKITRANPKVASYPFTTIEPNLGILSVQASPSIGIRAREVVIADIPGLIEGASQGKGLGLQFLRHIERCQVLLFLLSWDETLLYDEDMKNSEKITKLWSSYQVLLEEMKEYNSELLDKPQVIALNKIEIISEDLQQEAVIFFKKQGLELMLMSGITGKGLPAVTNALLKKLD